MRSTSKWIRWFGMASVVYAVGCGGPDANSPTRPLPPYSGRSTALFDDVIEPRAVGMDLEEAPQPRSDAMFRERTQVGDAVVRLRVETVTASADDESIKIQIGLRVLDVLTGSHPPPEEIVVIVDKSSPSLGVVKSLDARLGGKTFIGFLREFQVGDERRFHFHFAPDTKDVAAAVKDAVDLGEVQK